MKINEVEVPKWLKDLLDVRLRKIEVKRAYVDPERQEGEKTTNGCHYKIRITHCMLPCEDALTPGGRLMLLKIYKMSSA